jgi:hypothetical protein
MRPSACYSTQQCERSSALSVNRPEQRPDGAVSQLPGCEPAHARDGAHPSVLLTPRKIRRRQSEWISTGPPIHRKGRRREPRPPAPDNSGQDEERHLHPLLRGLPVSRVTEAARGQPLVARNGIGDAAARVRRGYLQNNKSRTGLPGGSRPKTAVNAWRVLSERRRRFPQVLPDS